MKNRSARRESLHETRHESFVLVYDDWHDPSREQTADALQHLEPFAAEEVVPGTIRVVGERRRVEKAAEKIENWNLSTETHLSDVPPHKTLVR